MSDPTNPPANAGGQHTAHVADELRTLQRPNGSKVSRVFAELRQAGDAVKAVTLAYGEFVRDYEAANVLELDRVQARLEYPPRPILDPETRLPIREPDEVDGKPNPIAGELVLGPSVVDTISDDDWERAGHKLRLPRSPDLATVIGHLLPVALDLAEDRVYRILALFLMDNREVARLRKSGELEQVLDEKAGDLLDEAFGDELLELAVVAGELVDHHFMRKARDLGDRAGNMLRLIGMGPRTPAGATATTPAEAPAEASSSTPATSTPASSTDSPASTDGRPTSPSTPPTTSSPTSAPASTSAASSSSAGKSKSA